MAEVSYNPSGASDAAAIYNEVFQQAKAELEPMGSKAAVNAALAIAAGAKARYEQAIAAGTAPAIALNQARESSRGEIDRVKAENGIAPPEAPRVDPLTNAVTGDDIEDAAKTLRTTTEKTRGEYERILDEDVAAPGAQGTQREIALNPVQAAQITPAQRIQAALQGRTQVEATDTRDLEATARGQGAGGQLAAARIAQAVRKNAQVASGAAQQARGAERKGALLAGIQQGGAQALDAEMKIEELNQADRQAAQAQIANIDSQRKQLQGQLDQAMRQGDQNAVNDIRKKMADLDQDAQKFNVGEKNQVATQNEDRSVDTQARGNDQRLAAQGQDETQRVAREELKIKAGEAANKAAQGLLSQAVIQDEIIRARRELDRLDKELQFRMDESARRAKQEERRFWADVVGRLVGATASVVASKPAAAHGGVVTETTDMIVGEAGPEIVIPIKSKGLTPEMLRALTVESKPFSREDAPTLDAVLKLMGMKKGGKSFADLLARSNLDAQKKANY